MVYLIHFEKKYKRVQHYIGYCRDGRLKDRMKRHSSGGGAVLMRVVSKAGIPWKVVRIWKRKGKEFERHLKNRKHANSFCPICNTKHKGEIL